MYFYIGLHFLCGTFRPFILIRAILLEDLVGNVTALSVVQVIELAFELYEQ
jgi:hypothetical protein